MSRFSGGDIPYKLSKDSLSSADLRRFHIDSRLFPLEDQSPSVNVSIQDKYYEIINQLVLMSIYNWAELINFLFRLLLILSHQPLNLIGFLI